MKTTAQQAFTLVEVILYIALAAVILTVITAFVSQIVQSRDRSQTVAEVEGQGAQVMQQILTTIRSATAINTPVAGTSAASLNIAVPVGAASPTVFDLNSGVIRITEGAGSPVGITSNAVQVSGLSFQNLSRAGTPGTVKVQFTISYINPDGRYEKDYEQTFYGSASLKGSP